jgi:hypothetical protein
MSLFRSMHRGSWVIERTFRRVGHIRRATGLREESDAAELERLLVRLSHLHRDELLMAFRDRLIAGDELYAAYLRGGMEGLPSVAHIKALDAAVEAWLASAAIAPRTRRDYAAILKRVIGGKPAKVSDLPTLLTRYRERTKGGRAFNLARAAARSFASSLMGRYSDLWNMLSNIRPRPVRRKAGHPQTPDEAREVAQALGRYGGMWWTLCTSGMSGGPDGPYFLERFSVTRQTRGTRRIEALAIHGTKREGRERVVPLVATPVRPLVKYPAFARALRAIGLTPNDGRRSYEAWMENAGIPKARRRRYMGHGTADVTDLYGDDYPLAEFLDADAARIRTYIGTDWTPGLAVMA